MTPEQQILTNADAWTCVALLVVVVVVAVWSLVFGKGLDEER